MRNRVKIIDVEVSSSIVSRIKYDNTKNMLKVYFIRKKSFFRTRTKEYSIPLIQFIELLNAPSIGKEILRLEKSFQSISMTR